MPSNLYQVELTITSKGEEQTQAVNFTGLVDLEQGDIMGVLAQLMRPPITAVAEPSDAETRDPRSKRCENPECARWYVPRTGTQRMCGRPECRLWRKTQPPKTPYGHRPRKAAPASPAQLAKDLSGDDPTPEEPTPEEAMATHESDPPWKPSVTIEAGNGVIAGSAMPSQAETDLSLNS